MHPECFLTDGGMGLGFALAHQATLAQAIAESEPQLRTNSAVQLHFFAPARPGRT
jgi:hypothetical protein